MPKARIARGGQSAGREVLALGVDRDQRPVARRQPLDRGDRQGEMEAGGAAQRVGVPGVVLAGGQHRRRVGGGGDPHAGAHVPHRARVLEQDDRRRPRSASTASRSTGGRRAIATTPVRGACGTSSASTSASTGVAAPAERAARSGASSRRQLLQLVGVGGDRLVHLGAEAQRVLERVEPLQHGQPRSRRAAR